MTQIFKAIKAGLGKIPFVRNTLTVNFVDKIELKKWKAGELKYPPSIVKQQVIRKEASLQKQKTFIETGTYLGDMLYAIRNDFDKIYSIELSNELFARAQKRFKRNKHIEIINGDSGE
ncbi:MAG: hypothetical protein PHF79_02140, partial [Candidatus Pacebacteria bacterium]|nr:hypothetical protein [Candidatus Paceibacterota bacterium]